MARGMKLGKWLRVVLICLVIGALSVIFPPAVSAGVNAQASGGSISGVVLDESDNPIQGAWVSVYGDSSAYWAYVDASDNGSYSITGLPADNYTVWAQASGYVAEYYDAVYVSTLATLVPVTPPNDTPNIDFVLGSGGSISGVVLDESDQPIEGARVSVGGDSLGYAAYAYTSDNGSYSITALHADNYTVIAQAPGYVMEYYDGVYDSTLATLVPVTLQNNTPNVDFVLGPGGSISGVVLDESDQPIEGAWVLATGRSSSHWGDAYTSDNGSYSITGLLSENYTVYAQASGYVAEYYNGAYDFGLATPVPVTVPNDTPNISFALGTGGSISGVVLDESDQPIEDAWVYASGDSSGLSASTYTSNNGSYIIGGLLSDNYTVRVEADGYVVEYYNGVYDWSSATMVPVTLPNDTPNINFALATADATPPSMPLVTDDGATTYTAIQLHATWISTDNETGIEEYEYAIGTTAGGTDVLDWTSTGTSTEVTKTGLSLTIGTTYYFAVKAKNGAGSWSTVGVSDGIQVMEDSTPPSTPAVTDDGATTYSTTQLHAAWTSNDGETGIAEYEYAIGTTAGGADLVGWTSTGASTAVTKTGLSLTAGTTYYFAVKAKNGVGSWSAVGVSDGIQVTADATPPSTPVVTDDGATTTSTTQLHATWTATDAESGIAEYQYAIGTTSGGTDVVNWTSAITYTQVTKTGLSLTLDTTYYLSVKAKNGQNAWSAVGTSDGIKVITPSDSTAPAAPIVTDDGDTTASTTQLHATWFATDAETGIAEYQYAIGTTSSGTDILDWTSAGTGTAVTKTGLTLTAGTKYFVSVKAKNGAGMWSEIGKSNGITVAPEGWVARSVSSSGGKIQTANGKITIELPANTSSGPLTVAVGGTTAPSPSDAKMPKGFKAGNTCFAIEITDASGNPVTTLSQPINITVKYSQEDVDAAGGDPSRLVIAYFDEESGKWVTLETTVNTTDMTLSATTTHASTWGTLAKSGGDKGTPAWVWILVAVGIVAIAAIGLIIWRRTARKPASAGHTPQ